VHVIKADLDVCPGFGTCVMNAPDLFELDDDDMVVVLKEDVDADGFAHADVAVRSCPVGALTLEPAG
jgi:ferredoxin